MIQYNTLYAPISMIDGIPASIAGEWPGIKPNKFKKTKKIIHIKNSSIFSLDDSCPVYSRKKRIIQKKPEEFPMKSQKRRVASAFHINTLKAKTLYNDFMPSPLQNYNRLVINREYDFEKRAKYYKMMQENHEKKLKEAEIMNKTKNNSIGISIYNNNPSKGFNKQFFENVSNHKNLGVTLTYDIYQNYKNKIEKMKKFKTDFGNVIFF